MSRPRHNFAGPVLVLRPHPLFVLLQPIRQYFWITALGLIAVLGSQAWTWVGLGGAPGRVPLLLIAGLVLLLRFLWAVADWATRAYGLSGGRVWAQRGVLSRRRDELPVPLIRAMAVVKPIEQRLFGIGSVGFATSGTTGYEVVWFIIGAPDEHLSAVRAAATPLEDAA